MQATADNSSALPRQLGFWALWLLVVNGLVGAGIFAVPASAARLAGDYSLWLYPLCALLILPIMLVVAELASRFQGSGGPALYASAAFGQAAGFQAGWLYYLARLVSVAANANLLLLSLAYFWPALGQGPARLLTLSVLFGVFGALNARATGSAMRSLGLLTLLKFAILVLFVLLAGGWALWQQLPAPAVSQQPLQLGSAVLLLIYAFVGFESALIPAGEAKNPRRHLPLALLSGLLLVTLLYLAIQWVCLQYLPTDSQSQTPLLDVAGLLGGPLAASLLMIGVAGSVAANLLGAIFSTPRVSVALASQGSLPGWFARVHPKRHTPANAIWFFTGLALLLALAGNFAYLAAATVLIRALLYGICALAVPRLRLLQPRSGLVFPGGATLPLLALVSCLLLASQVSLASVLLTCLLLLLGALLYRLARQQQLPA